MLSASLHVHYMYCILTVNVGSFEIGLVYSLEVGQSLDQMKEVVTVRRLEYTNPTPDLGDYSNFILGTRMKQNSCFLPTSCVETEEVQFLL